MMATTHRFLFLFGLLICMLGTTLGGYIPPGPKYRCPEEGILLHPCKCVKESDVGLYIYCENSNLASISVGLNNLATFQLPIEELIIYKCHISK